VSLFDGLSLSGFPGDDHISQELLLTSWALPFHLGKGKDIGRTVLATVIAVKVPDLIIIRYKDAQFRFTPARVS